MRSRGNFRIAVTRPVSIRALRLVGLSRESRAINWFADCSLRELRTSMPTDPVDVILDFHGIAGPWKPLKVTGMANRIYATEEIVLRIATEHPQAVADARTESVAAPAAFAAGIMTPR